MAGKTTKKGTTKAAGKKTRKVDATAERVLRPGMKRLRSVGRVAILESLLIGALGVILLINSTGFTKVIFYVVGICLMIKGVYKILNYFASHGKYDFYNNDLLYGIIALVFGVIMVVLWETLASAIGIVVGAWMIYGALVRMNTAIKMRVAGIKEWFYALILSMAMLALGIYLIIAVGAVLTIVGWVMIAAAVIGVIDDVVFIRHLDKIVEQL